MNDSKKRKLLEDLANYDPTTKEIAEAIENLAGGSVEWILKTVFKHQSDMVKEVIDTAEKKKASPFVVVSLLAVITKLSANSLEKLAKEVGHKELEILCKRRGINIEDLKRVFENKDIVDYIT